VDISFTCHQCEQHLVIAKEGAGLTIQCPKCNSSVLVPNSGGLPPTTSPNAEPYESPAKSNGLESFINFIDELAFCGNFRKSLSGQYAIAWGSTQPGKGGGEYDNTYLLLRDEVVVLKGSRSHIMSAIVADNGTFLLWNSSKSGSDAITLHDQTGTRLKQMRFRCVYPPTFDIANATANMEVPAEWAKNPSGAVRFNLLDGTCKVVKPNNRSPYPQ